MMGASSYFFIFFFLVFFFFVFFFLDDEFLRHLVWSHRLGDCVFNIMLSPSPNARVKSSAQKPGAQAALCCIFLRILLTLSVDRGMALVAAFYGCRSYNFQAV